MHDNSKITFPFLLSQADQGDLEKVKKDDTYKEDPQFRKVIDDAFPKAEPARTRHERGRFKLAIIMVINVMNHAKWLQTPGIVTASFVSAEEEGTKLVESINKNTTSSFTTEVSSSVSKQSESNIPPTAKC